MIKAYFFDWMGTLGNADGDVTNLVTKKEHHALLTNKFEEANISEAYQEKVHLTLSNATHCLYSDSKKIIKKLKLNYKLAIVSNMYDITAKKIKELFPEFLRQFDIITFSSDVGMKKPDPRIFFYTLNRLNELNGRDISFEEVVMVGDKYDKDIEPALNCGMQARFIDRTKQNLEDII